MRCGVGGQRFRMHVDQRDEHLVLLRHCVPIPYVPVNISYLRISRTCEYLVPASNSYLRMTRTEDDSYLRITCI
ncbi:hypothetical protein EB796_004758 [Bugula neritina]|uniref:Uncharacterized protein n=1 Tax=Bugula neritina TaxID=10212 RepID=A0A7J7KE75_BUGNE|nr:hypothetical protein EB796_004758 [Bugula neritina]